METIRETIERMVNIPEEERSVWIEYVEMGAKELKIEDGKIRVVRATRKDGSSIWGWSGAATFGREEERTKVEHACYTEEQWEEDWKDEAIEKVGKEGWKLTVKHIEPEKIIRLDGCEIVYEV